MKTSVTLLLILTTYHCTAQTDGREGCPPALYIEAGSQGEFASPNANSTCENALISFLEKNSNQTVSVQQGESVCGVYPLIHISIPTDTPVGTAKITWLCDDEKPNPCQLMFVQPVAPSSIAQVSEFAMSLECPSSEVGAISQTNIPYQVQTTSALGQVTGTPWTGSSPDTALYQHESAATMNAESDATANGETVPKPTQPGTDLYTGNSNQAHPTEVGTRAVPSDQINNSVSANTAIRTTQLADEAITGPTESPGPNSPTGTATMTGTTQTATGGSDSPATNGGCTCVPAST